MTILHCFEKSLSTFCLVFWLVFVSSLFLPRTALGSYECDSLNCQNNATCKHNEWGVAFCQCRRPISALEPNFFIGKHCDIPAQLCADTSTFYCANGATCVEIVQGENYTCQHCGAQFTGEHCEQLGVPCGAKATTGSLPVASAGSSARLGKTKTSSDGSPLYCFNGGKCKESSSSNQVEMRAAAYHRNKKSAFWCECMKDWSVEEDCSVPIPGFHPPSEGFSYSSASSLSSSSSPSFQRSEEEEEAFYWYVPYIGAFAALVVLCILGSWIYCCYFRQSKESVVGARRLPVQEDEFSDLLDDEEDSDDEEERGILGGRREKVEGEIEDGEGRKVDSSSREGGTSADGKFSGDFTQERSGKTPVKRFIGKGEEGQEEGRGLLAMNESEREREEVHEGGDAAVDIESEKRAGKTKEAGREDKSGSDEVAVARGGTIGDREREDSREGEGEREKPPRSQSPAVIGDDGGDKGDVRIEMVGLQLHSEPDKQESTLP